MQDLGSFPVFASLLAGILTFISPCILPLIPVYITLVTGLSIEELDNRKNLLSVFLSSICFVLGFTTVFVFLGLSVTIIGQFFLNNIYCKSWKKCSKYEKQQENHADRRPSYRKAPHRTLCRIAETETRTAG